MKCLEKRPSERFASARALRNALDACQDAGAWQERDALSWWAEHERALDAARITLDREKPAATIAIDWTRREGASAQPSFPSRTNGSTLASSTVPEGAQLESTAARSASANARGLSA